MWDRRINRCPGCQRSTSRVAYGGSGLCAECLAALVDSQKRVRALRCMPPDSAECALGCLLHNLSRAEVARILNADELDVAAWVVSGVIDDERVVAMVWACWRLIAPKVGRGAGPISSRSTPGRRAT